jgi:hypothetical protein
MMVMNPFLKENRERMKDYLNYAVHSGTSSQDEQAGSPYHPLPPLPPASPLKKRGVKVSSISASMPSLHSPISASKFGSGDLRLGLKGSIEFTHNEEIETLFTFLGKSLQKLETDILDRHLQSSGTSPVNNKEVLEGLAESFLEMKRLIENSVYADAETKRKNSSFMGRIGKLGKMFVTSSTLPTM